MDMKNKIKDLIDNIEIGNADAINVTLGKAGRKRWLGRRPSVRGSAMNPVDQFHRNCWVAPFVEDDVSDLAKHMPVERILFGSDWPHAEGVGHPRDFLKNLTGFSQSEQQRIMVDNARELTFA